MFVPSPFTLPILTRGTRERIAATMLWHYTTPAWAERIVQREPLPPGSGFGNALVHLSPPQGWTLQFWKFVRDLTVLDPGFAEAGNWGRYLYFFLGEPSAAVREMNVQNASVSIQVRGQDLLAQAGERVLFRGLDKVVVVRGDYRGPALVTPLPIRP